MLFTSTKFIGGRNIQQATTLTFTRTAGSGLGEFFDRVSITDPTAITKLGNGNHQRSDVIATVTRGGSVPVELNPGTYSMRVTAAQVFSDYSPFDANLDGTIYIKLARMVNMNANDYAFDPSSLLYSGDLVDTDNEELDGTKKWLFEDFDITSSGDFDFGNGTNQSVPFTLAKNIVITNAMATRITSGPVADDASVGFFAFFDVPTSGTPMSASLTLELVRGYDFL